MKSMIGKFNGALLVLALAGTSAVHADGEDVVAGVSVLAGHAGSAVSISPEQRLRENLRVLLLEMVQTGAFGTAPTSGITLSIEEPRQRVGSLGVLVDSAGAERARDGLRVLGTTPGGSAERIGVRAGDLIVGVNGVSLAGLGVEPGGSSLAAARLREQVDALDDGAALAIDLQRDGRPLRVEGAVASTWIPAMRLVVGDGALLADSGSTGASAAMTAGCGRISIFDVAPRQESLHAATLNQIDGRAPGVTGQTSFRVPAGVHVLEVGEAIENRYLSFNDRQRNSGPSRYKSLTVTVAADTTYHVAARLNEDKRSEWRDGAFWDPVVWRESAEPCR